MLHFFHGTHQITVRPASPSDLDKMAQLYRCVQITAQRCHETLNKTNGSFARRGGMFEINQPADLERILNDKSEKLIVGESNGDVRGLLWYGMARTDTFAGLKPFPDKQEAAAKLARARESGSCGYAKEIISVEDDNDYKLPYALFYAMMDDYVKSGVERTVGEVYRIDRYQTQGQTFESGLLNLASYGFLNKCGGEELGCTAQKQVDLEGYSVWKTPHIIQWETKAAKETIRRELSNAGWDII